METAIDRCNIPQIALEKWYIAKKHKLNFLLSSNSYTKSDTT